MSARPTSSTGESYPAVLGYHIVQLLGGGGFSRVFRAVNPQSSQHPQAAVKVVSYAPTTHRQPIDRRALQKEVQIHSILKHENVLAFLGSVEYPLDSTAPSNYVRGLYILLELGAGGDLFDKIGACAQQLTLAPDVGVEEDLAHFYFTQLIAGLVYIHGQGITHRDIKPENMLLDAQGNLKIADFGLCSVYRYKGKERTLHGTCGSLPYIAPEMNGTPYHGEPVDVWSSGVVLFALLVGNTPWDEPTKRSPEYVAYLSGELLRMAPWTAIGGDALSLLRRMMHPDPRRRSTLEQIQRHRWFTRENSLLTLGKCNDPVSLAERLLQGLIVSGDMQLALHSDGKRASIPDNLSLTQPEALQPRMGVGYQGIPSSTAQPALARRPLFSQLPPRSKAVGATQTEGLNEFTQALGYLTQASTAAPMAVQLTRFYSVQEPGKVANAVAAALQAENAQFTFEPIGGEEAELQEAYHGMTQNDAQPPSHDAKALSARGVRIRLGLVDRRKCALKGEVRIERIAELPPELHHVPHSATHTHSFVLMRRSKGNPLEWRRLFRSLCANANVHDLIARLHS